MYGYQTDIEYISNWLKRNKVKPSTFGRVLGGSIGLAERVLKGNCTIKTLRRALRHVDKYPKVKNQYRGR